MPNLPAILSLILLASAPMLFRRFSHKPKTIYEHAGFDWIKYSKEKKAQLIDAMHTHLKVDKTLYGVEKGVIVMDEFYDIMSKYVTAGVRHIGAEIVINASCVGMLSRIIRFSKNRYKLSKEDLLHIGLQITNDRYKQLAEQGWG